mmetsp:Transcript_5305/g.6628  ORF Transcript_5305/g.6628 Transcript_5305/m.6628 type:complete len:191 (-) Transcript_5305:102-674(-)
MIVQSSQIFLFLQKNSVPTTPLPFTTSIEIINNIVTISHYLRPPNIASPLIDKNPLSIDNDNTILPPKTTNSTGSIETPVSPSTITIPITKMSLPSNNPNDNNPLLNITPCNSVMDAMCIQTPTPVTSLPQYDSSPNLNTLLRCQKVQIRTNPNSPFKNRGTPQPSNHFNLQTQTIHLLLPKKLLQIFHH